MRADRHLDKSSTGFLHPTAGRKVPWLTARPMTGLYTTKLGEVHHWLATASDARRPLFARLSDKEHAFTLFNVKDVSLTHSEYVSLYTLNERKSLRGPPGSNSKRSNFKPSESRITDVRQWVFLTKTKLSNHFPDGSGTEGSNPGGGLVVVKNFPKGK